MAHDHDGALVGLEEPLEPGDALQVEVVGGLVEQQHVGLREQDLGERHAHLPPARELRDVLGEVGLPEPKSAKHRARLGLHGVAAHMLEAIAQPSVLGKEPAGVLGGGGRKLFFEHADAMLQTAHARRGREHLFQNAGAVHLDGLLAEVAHRSVLATDDRA